MTEEKVETKTNGQENKETTNISAELESSIIRQVEYYFGNINIPRDKFLREQILLDDGWVPLDILTRFNRLSKMTTDTEVIAQAILKSSTGLLEISDDNKKVRRNPELPIPEMSEDRRKELADRTIYAKGFPKEVSLDDLLKYFKQFEEVENVIMRKYQDRVTKKRLFKGSVFATFKTKEQAEKFIALKDIKYEDTDLLILWQNVYIEKKQEEYAAKKKQQKDKGRDKHGDAQTEEKGEFKLPTGSVLSFGEGTDKMTREDIKEALTALGAEVAYIDFKVGDTKGWVRLVKEDSAKELYEKITDGKIKIAEADVAFQLLEGDEETVYLNKTIEEMSKRRRNMRNNKYKGKSFKGQRGKKRKQERNDNDGDAPPAKVKAGDS